MKLAGKFWVPDSEQIQLDALAAGGWQLDHLNMALEHVTDFSAAVDGGAHVGSWTIEMAKVFREVHSFEPCPETYDCLLENTKHISGIRRYTCALGDEPKHMGMAEDRKYSDGGNTGGRYLSGDGEIVVSPLDMWELPTLGFLKLDVEGYELFALRGARETLFRCRPVVFIEDKIRMAHRFGLEPHAAVRFLVDMGMREVDHIGADKVFKW